MKNNAFLKTGRRWLVRGFFVAVGATLSAFFAVPANAQPRQTLPGNVPAAIARLHLQPLRQVAATNQLHLAIGLPLRNPEALTGLLRQLYDPASPNYRHFLTAEQFTAQFGPTERDYQAVVAFARANGLRVTGTFSNRLLVDVSGTVGNVERALHVKMLVYQHPKESRTFYAPDTNPTLDLAVPVAHISGLDDYSLPRPLLKATPLSQLKNVKPADGSGPSGLYIGNDFRTAYVPGTPLTGAGQVVGLLEFDGYYANDIAQYVNQAGLPSVPLENVYVDGFSGTPGFGNGEVALDIEVVIAMAPGVSKIVVYQAPNPSPWVDLLNRMALDTQVKQFSCSWGGGPPDANADAIFLQMAAQGQSFFNASGDSDAFTGPVDFPADNPYVTEVGGTTLTMSGTGDAYESERVWNWGNGVGSSGGISTYYTIPVWQQGLDMSANGGSTTFRNIPDVALTADNIYIIADNGTPEAVGGTSAAAPLWAGYTALVNQQAAIAGNPPVGFVNPAIYTIAKSSAYTSLFHDITTGDNTSPSSPGRFFATAGYDLCTGWGTPTTELIPVLAGVPPRNGFLVLSVNPPSDSAILSGSSQPIAVTVNDVFGVTNATVTATIPGITNLTFVNSSTSLATYTATLQVPNVTTQVTMTVTATAPDEIGATNEVNYFIGSPPANDDFVNATKVPVGGASYLSNNRFATIETNEPAHNGDINAAGSLWWNWTPAGNTNVFISTIGSKVENVLAVYTGFALTTNMPVVAATNSALAQFKPAQVTFAATAGVTYHIAVASVNSNAVGTVGLAVAPGGQPDTTKPLVSITSPLNGLTVTNNLITVAGTASDPQPNVSGVAQVSLSVNGSVYVVSGTSGWTAPAALQPGVNTIQATAIDQSGNVSSPAAIEVSYVIFGPANDFFAQAIPLAGTSGVVSSSTVNATKEVGEPNHAGNAGGKSVWWSFQAPANGVLTLSTSNSTFDTLLGLYTGGTVSNLTLIASDDDAYDGAPGGFSYITHAVQSNQVYHIAVDGYNGASGTNYLAYAFTPAAVYRLTVGSGTGGTVAVTSSNGTGGVFVMPGAAGDFAAGATVQLTATPDAFYQFSDWNGDSLLSANPLSVTINSDTNFTANFVPLAMTDGFESGNLQHLTWATGGDAPWFVQSSVVESGQYAARSGVIGNNQTSSLIITTNFLAGVGAFDYRVSTETNFDYLRFYVNGILMHKWSGEAGWATYSFPVNAGTNTLQWTYVKDPSLTNGLDAAFIDNVFLPLASTTITSVPASPRLVVSQSGGSLVIQISGQTSQQYILQASTNLVDWQDISTNVAVGGSIQLTNPVSASFPARFYRVVVPH